MVKTRCRLTPRWIPAAVLVFSGLSVAEGEEPPDFARLTVGDDTVYRDCHVVRAESDALVIRHDRGVARVSLFDLPSDIQEKYEFDPVTAMAQYKRDLERQRVLKKTLLHEAEKAKAAEAARQAEERLQREAEQTWVPAEGRILLRRPDGLFVAAQRIVMVPTKTKSTLGLPIDGPPRRELAPFSSESGTVFLAGATPLEGHPYWQGYIEPFSSGQRTLRIRATARPVPVHRAVNRR